jgi:basic membrane protein A
MKKFLICLIALTLVVGLLTTFGCAKKEVKVEKVKIALILPSGKDDMAWSQGMYEGVMAAQKELGVDNVEVSLTENMPDPVNAGAALRDYANKGYNIIIAHGSQYQNSVMDVAKEFPKISFAYGTAFQTASNVFAYNEEAQDGAYAFGVLAAKLTKSKIVGIVGPVKTGDAIKYNYGFQQGVESVDPTIKIMESYTGSFGDIIKAKEMATAEIDAGADILTGTAQQTPGAIQAVSEKTGVYWFSSDVDQSSLAPDHIIASQVYRWKDVVLYMIDSFKNGKLGGEVIPLDLTNGRIQIIFNPKLKTLITPELEKLFNETIEKIKSGSIKVKLP